MYGRNAAPRAPVTRAKPTTAALKDALAALQKLLAAHGDAGYSALRRALEGHKNRSRLQAEIAERERELATLKAKSSPPKKKGV